jgi:ribonuclease VapC
MSISPVRRPKPIDLVVDSSALIAVLFKEDLGERIHGTLSHLTGTAVTSAANVLECSMVLSGRLGAEHVGLLDEFLGAAEIIAMPIDSSQIEQARAAWARFGRGNHPARLNFGDCFTYALAAHLDVPLLCTGDDFARTDLTLIAL